MDLLLARRTITESSLYITMILIMGLALEALLVLRRINIMFINIDILGNHVLREAPAYGHERRPDHALVHAQHK